MTTEPDMVAEVLNHAPPGLTAAERLVLISIAMEVREFGRHCEIPSSELRRQTRMSGRGVRYALERLAKRGIEVRVPIGTDRHGKPFYAVRGSSPVFVLPRLAPPEERCGAIRRGDAPSEPT